MIDAGRHDAGEAIQLRAAERGGVLDGPRDALFELRDALRMTGNAAFAGPPVARGQVVEHLRQAVLVEPGAEVVDRMLVGKEVFDAAEASALRSGKPIEKSGLVEEHRQVGGKFRHRVFRPWA